MLGPIVKDAHPGDVIEVHTQEMWELATETIRKEGRMTWWCDYWKLRRGEWLEMLEERGSPPRAYRSH